MSSFRIEGDARSASIAVDGMDPEELAVCVRRVLMEVYARQGTTVTEDDMTIVNLALGEARLASEAAERAHRRMRRITMFMYVTVGANVGAALFNLGVVFAR